MKFNQLTEYNMRNIFPEKLYQKRGGETIPRPFSKNKNWVDLWMNSLKFYSLFLLHAKLRAFEIHWN